jgi:hypothetical protein
MKRLVLAVFLLLSAPALFAWGEKGHLMIGEAAGLALPTDMPPFFLQRTSELTWLNPEPDRWKGNVDVLGAMNPPDHFLDYEYTLEYSQKRPLPRDRYKFIEQMSGYEYVERKVDIPGRPKGERDSQMTVSDVSLGRNVFFQRRLKYSEPGFLPWRIAELTERLTVQFRMWRGSRDPMERSFIENSIIQTAGILGHFAADSSNPHHTTLNYNGWALPQPTPNGYAIDCGTHSRFETQFVVRATDREMISAKVAAPVVYADPFDAAMTGIRHANTLVDRLYQLDRDRAFSPIGAPSQQGVEFAVERMASGASLLRDLWYSAWVNSGKPVRGRGED